MMLYLNITNVLVNYKDRGVAQLAARLLWEQDAAGSNPVTPIVVYAWRSTSVRNEA